MWEPCIALAMGAILGTVFELLSQVPALDCQHQMLSAPVKSLLALCCVLWSTGDAQVGARLRLRVGFAVQLSDRRLKYVSVLQVALVRETAVRRNMLLFSSILSGQ